MSKESKLRDLHRQSIEAVRDRNGFCPGCGPVHGTHRPDCTAEPTPLTCSAPGCDATRPAGARTPLWRYDTRGYYCPTHQKGAA